MEATSGSIAEVQARIDDEVALLRLPICALLIQRNALSPVSRLPHEILATIFLYQAYSFYQDPRYSGTWGAPPWANVSYVCRHWRDVALNTSFLWSFLLVSPPRWTKELLSRTNMLPLRIRINVRYWARKEMIFLEQVTTDVTRIQDLSLKLPRNLTEGVFSKLSTPAPLLHTLRLFVTQNDTESVLVPDTLFSRETPALRTLELYRCHVPWSSPIFTTLTTLRLRDIASSSQPTITEILAILRHMPDLAHLYLENALPSAEDTLHSRDSLPSECFDLPHLSCLALVAPFSTVVVFLSNVTVPLKTEIRLCCRRDVFTASYAPLYPLLERRFNTASDVGPVIQCGQRRLHEDWGRGIALKVDIRAQLSERSGGSWLATFVVSYPWYIFTPSLILSRRTSKRMIGSQSFLGDHARRQYGVENAEDIFAPALAELRVSAVTFSYNCHPRSRGCSGSARCLHKALARRKAKGYALKKLVIADSSYVPDAQVEELREVVDEVDWDGYTQASGGTNGSDGDD
ncbi:hypothetical protein BU15DRAFT_81185 [Melanogaster broomeanus]|nr:hypothetical protein BU15DRAFT_81185 [Melanogaster broomeanus]